MKWLLLSLFQTCCFASQMTFPWVVFYGDKEEISMFEPYNPVVLDNATQVDITALLAQKKEVLGYINLGEVDDWNPWFNEAKSHGLLIEENPNWKGSWAVDVRKPIWKKMLIEKIIPSIFAKGFIGLIYDQIDIPIGLEEKDPQKYQGMVTATVDLVKAIRQNFPGKKIMMNRGYQIMDQVGNDIDYQLAEALYTDYDFDTKEYSIRPKEDHQWQMDLLNKARKKYPHLVIFSLDYWDPTDKEMYKKIYAVERKNCIRPYVSVVALDMVVPEPKE